MRACNTWKVSDLYGKAKYDGKSMCDMTLKATHSRVMQAEFAFI